MEEIIAPYKDSSSGVGQLSRDITTNNVFLTEPNQEVAPVFSQYFSDIRTRSAINHGSIYTVKPINTSIPQQMSMDFSRIVNKPFLITKYNWTITAQIYSTIGSLRIPLDLYHDLPAGSALRAPFDVSAIYRANIKLLLQVSGTPMHQGILIASAVPIDAPPTNISIDQNRRIFSQNMASPHTFLAANSSSSVTLEIPFYSPTKYLFTEFENTAGDYTGGKGNYAEMRLTVLSPLIAPTNGSTTLTISVYAMFDDAQFFIPHADVGFVPFVGQSKLVSGVVDVVFNNVKKLSSDFIDGCRAVFRDYTGLHNPNKIVVQKIIKETRHPLNNTDIEVNLDKVDPFAQFTRVMQEAVFETGEDEMLVNHIVSKPQYIGSFSVSSTTPVNALLWSRPITPLQEIVPFTVDEEVRYCFTIPISVLCRLSRYWKGSLNIHIQSSMSNFHFCKLVVARDYSPVKQSLTSYPSFREVANLLVSNLEFSGGGQVQTISMPYMSLFDQLEISEDYGVNALQHGMYYVYLDQPLITNGSVSSKIDFNVFLSLGEDFQLFGYSVSNYAIIDPVFFGQSLINTVSSDRNICNQVVKVSEPISPNPNFHLNSHLRDYLRRYYQVKTLTLDPAIVSIVIPVVELLGIIPSSDNLTYPTLRILSKLFLGYTGGIRIKLRVTGVYDVNITYIPPASRVLSNSTTDAGFVSSTLVGDSTIPGVAASVAVESTLAYNTIKSYQTVGIETATKSKENSNALAPMEVEFEIPNMSPFRFIGSSRNQYLDANTRFASNDLGSIGVSFLKHTNDIASIKFFVSHSDEARFGFQVFSPTITQEFFTSGGVQYQISPFNSKFSNPSPPFYRPASIAPACYVG